jgi:hypothetical protein
MRNEEVKLTLCSIIFRKTEVVRLSWWILKAASLYASPRIPDHRQELKKKLPVTFKVCKKEQWPCE